MNDSKRRKRRHDSDASNGDEGKSRKTARKTSEISQQIAKERRKKKSRHKSSSSSSNSESERSDSSDQPRKKKKDAHKKDKRKKEKRKRKREKKEKKNKRRKARDDEKAAVKSTDISANSNRTQAVDISRKPVSADPEVFPKKRPMVPMTKEEYEKQRAQVRRVYDPETGRHRLVKGTGEILEEIVSRDRHKAINKTATQGDGAFFQANLGLKDK
ncbi:ADP-ribosylation factor-like protein 6-interacting protein 4 [Desmophyllum pertusum]|uniref:ADP-ribosylation factor-like protein 6-interacting protein 4 n=1 Tax=Desmophyllum pertusum TaxID=174260 RepID=A0A9X0CJ09_9CNID|nr:ADP-ribosylation factor-like protein 6-interacting protein 4 [Desmophyllum pertusum]